MKPKTLAEVRQRSLAHAMDQVHLPQFVNPQRAGDILPILFCGGIGDTILSLPLLDEIIKIAKPVRIYSTAPDAIAYFRPEYSAYLCTDPFPGYDYWLIVETVPRFRLGKNYRRMSTSAAGLYFASQVFAADRNIGRFIDYQPQFDYELWRSAINMGLKRNTIGCEALGLPYRSRQKLIQQVIDLEPFITVHDGYDQTQKMVPYRATKNWNLNYWGELVRRIKNSFPMLNVVQLGSQTSRPIPGVDFNFAGRLKLEQSFNILGRSRLHIDGDSGLVHAAHVMGVRSVVMFGPTPKEFFGYGENVNLEPNFCGNCGWTTQTWMQECPLYDSPRCMDSISVDEVGEVLFELGGLLSS